MRTFVGIPCYSLAGIVNGHVERVDKLHPCFDIAFGSGNIQNQITLFLRRHLRTIHVHDQIVVLDQMVNDRLFALTFREEQHQLLCYSLGHCGFSLTKSGFIVVSLGRYWIGSARRKSPRLISSASR